MICMLVDSQVGPGIEPKTSSIQSRWSYNWAIGAAGMTIPLIVANTTD